MLVNRSIEQKYPENKSNSAKFIFQEKEEDTECSNCGGELSWCSSCMMYSRTCCEEYGTCQCS